MQPIEECGSESPNGRICNHRKGHKGKCLRIEDGKRGKHVVEYWIPNWREVDEQK